MVGGPSNGFHHSMLTIILDEFAIRRIADEFMEILLKLVLSQLSFLGIAVHKRSDPIALLKLQDTVTACDYKPQFDVEVQQAIMDFVLDTRLQSTQQFFRDIVVLSLETFIERPAVGRDL